MTPVHRGRTRLTARLAPNRENLRRRVDRFAMRASERAQRGPGPALIGLDVSRPPRRLQPRSWVQVVAAVLVGALLLAGLRMDVIRMRYALTEAFEQEQRLEEVKRQLTVEVRELRDPAELARRAYDLGFRSAEKLIDLSTAESRGELPSTSPIELAASQTGGRP